MKHSPLLGQGVTTTRNSLLLCTLALGLSAATCQASSRTTLIIPSLTFAQSQQAPSSSATTQDIQGALRQGALDQLQVRSHTEEVVSQVQDLIDELAANGISGDDAKILQATKAVLGHLSGPEMDQVIASLQQAGSAKNATDAAHQSVTAYVGQKGIILQFRVILAEYEKRQALTELQAKFKDLTHRQTETMRTTAGVARDTMGKNAVELTTGEVTTREIVQADQEAIVNEANLAGKQLDTAAQASADDDAKPLQKAQDDMKNGQVETILSQADEDVKSGLLMKAVGEQIAARDQLRRITLDLNPPADTAEAIEQTAVDLARLIDEQKKLLGQTNSAISAKVMVSGLDDQQGVLVDEANLVQQDTLSLSVDAAGLVKEAINPPMQTSRAQLHDLGGLGSASTSQEQAIAKLEAAQKLLEKELADAKEKEKANETADSKQTAPDPTAMTQASEEITKAETNLSPATSDTTPSDTPPAPTPSDTKPVADNPPDGKTPDTAPAAGTPSDPITMEGAMTALTNAETNVDKVANTPGLPDSTQKAITDAKTEIEKGKTAAGKGDAPGTASHAGLAMTALIKAQTSISLAIAGMPGAGLSGKPMPASTAPSRPGKFAAQSLTPGSVQPGVLHDVADNTGKYIPEQMRERIALSMAGTEKRPQEYAPLIDQYLKNISDQATPQ